MTPGTVAPAQLMDPVTAISTRQLRDASLRALRARGVPYAAALPAAVGIEWMEAVAGMGLASVVALLERPSAAGVWAWKLDPTEKPRPALDASGVLLAAPLTELLAAAPGPLSLGELQEPWMLVPALVDYVALTGRALTVTWTRGSHSGSCTANKSNTRLMAAASAGPGPWACRLVLDQLLEVSGEPRGEALLLQPGHAARLVSAARRDGLTVDGGQWHCLLEHARGFLVEDGR